MTNTVQIPALALFLQRECSETALEASRAIDRARDELDKVERELNKAIARKPYLRIGRIEGLDAAAVFAAFGAVERQALIEQTLTAPTRIKLGA